MAGGVCIQTRLINYPQNTKLRTILPGAVSPYLFQMNNLKYSKQTRFYELQKENEWQGEGGIANLLAYQQVAILIEFLIPRR